MKRDKKDDELLKQKGWTPLHFWEKSFKRYFLLYSVSKILH